MHTISKEQIEQLLKTGRLFKGETDMLQGLLAQPEGEPVNHALLTTPEIKALARFCETCEDGEGYDVPKTMMQRLSQIGVLRHLSKGIYTITEFGQTVIDTHPSPTQLPLTDDTRGFLAAKLQCWHRLTEVESDELVALFAAHKIGVKA